MKRCFEILLVLCLFVGFSLAEPIEAAPVDPFAPVTAAEMTVTDAELNEDGTLSVHTGSFLSAAQADFGEGAAIIRILAAVPAEGKMVIRMHLDDPEGSAFISAVFSPLTKEYRMSRNVEGVHDVYLRFEGEGTFTSWQALFIR